MVVYDSVNGRVAIFEAKYSKTLQDMTEDCKRAIRQISDRMYAKDFQDDYDQICCYGISFIKTLYGDVCRGRAGGFSRI